LKFKGSEKAVDGLFPVRKKRAEEDFSDGGTFILLYFFGFRKLLQNHGLEIRKKDNPLFKSFEGSGPL
jgi:hypothetical protein